MKEINETVLDGIRSILPEHISGKRLLHTLSVEAEAEALGKLFRLPDEEIYKLRCAALLHDITKEKKLDGQIELCKRFGIDYTDEDVRSPKVFHAFTGAFLARELFPELVDDVIFNGIRYHTTGRENMSLFEKLIYLADYIEPQRTFEDCVKLRKLFYSTEKFDQEHLDRIMLLSFNMTLSCLIVENAPMHSATVRARNALIM